MSELVKEKSPVAEEATYAIETITPEYAEEILRDKNHRNRSIRELQVMSLAFAIDTGKWKPETNDAVCFDSEGFLLNGQHRFSAVVLAGKPVQMLVGRNVPEESFSVMDTGSKRTTADFLRANSVPYAAQIGTVSRMYLSRNPDGLDGLSYLKSAKASRRLSNEDILEFQKEHASDLEFCCRVVGNRLSKIAPSSFLSLGLYHLLENGANQEELEQMMIDSSPEYRGSLPSNHPARVMCKYFVDAKMMRKSHLPQEVVSIMIDCYNDIVSGVDSRRYYKPSAELSSVKKRRNTPVGN